MKYNITRNKKIIATVTPTGTYDAKIMGDETVTMNFTLFEPITFLIGDMVEVYGQLFILNIAPTQEKVSSIQYNYSLQFESIKYELGKVQFLFPDANNELLISDFSIMGDAKKILELIVQNANRNQSDWKLGKVDQTDTKNISFSANSLLTALATLADEFENEFWIDQDKTIHFTTKKEVSGLTIQYGKNYGLRSLSRTVVDSSNIVTRLYAYGSTKNIAAQESNWANRLTMDVPYLEKNTDKYGIIEHTELFEDVYPNRIGKVTAVNDNYLQFSDDTLEFDLNSNDILISGTAVKVTFNTGQLAGYTFEVKKYGFNYKTKTFELEPNKEEKSVTVPSKLIRPAVGDQYVLTDIIMPEQYRIEAKNKLKAKANEYILANCEPRLQYSVVSDFFYFEDQNIQIALGKTIRMIDKSFQLEADIRVIGISQDLQNKYNVQFELADEVQVSRITREYLDDRKWQNQIINHQQKVDRNIRRNYQFSREIQENIFDNDGYFDTEKIKPLSIETKMLSVGARSQQFSITNARLITIDNSTIKNEIGQLVHFTIEDKERVWNIIESTITNIKDSFNYIYVKCQRNGNNANFVITTEKIKVDQDPTYFYFEYGFLSSIMDGFRRIRTSYGFTDINGGEITTGKILGQSGETFIDIDNRKIYGSVEFLPNSPAFDQIKDSINIGGRNLFLDSALINNYNKFLSTKDITSAYYTYKDVDENKISIPNIYGLLIHSNTSGNDSFVYLDQNLTLEKNTEYTFSFIYRCAGGAISSNVFVKLGDSHIKVDFKPITDHLDHKVSFTFNSNNETTAVLRFGFIKSSYFWSIFYGIKIEKGNTPTDWTPAPEDIQGQITEIENITSFLGTTIDNNTVATGTLLVGDGNTNTGGISGIRDQGNESICFYSGQDWNNRYSAPFRVTHAGNVVMTNAYVAGHVVATSGSFTGIVNAESGKFQGEINALSGKIGRDVNYFKITEKGIESKNGWIFIGDMSNSPENRGRGVQIIKTPNNINEPLISISDFQTAPNIHKQGMIIHTEGGLSNTALSLIGDLIVNGKKGYTGTISILRIKIYVENGIITGWE